MTTVAASLPQTFSDFVVPTLGAICTVGTTIACLVWEDRRRRHRGERSPMSLKLLRPPGYTLLDRWHVTTEKLSTAMLYVSMLGVLLGFGAVVLVPLVWRILMGRINVQELTTNPGASVLLAFAALFVATLCGVIWCGRRVLQLREEVRTCRLGLRGEQAVGEALLDPGVIGAGYRSFHDVPGDGAWNIDHVVVGPAGVFVLETKARTKRLGLQGQPGHEVIYDGRMLRFPNWNDDTTVRQVRRNSEWIKGFIKEFGPPGILIHPVVLIPGWFVRSTGDFPVKVMNSTYLPGYLRGARPLYSANDLRSLFRRLDERCRTLEF